MASVEEIKAGVEVAIDHADKAPVVAAKEQVGRLSVATVIERFDDAIQAMTDLLSASEDIPCQAILDESRMSSAQLEAVAEDARSPLVDSMRDKVHKMGEHGGYEAHGLIQAFRQIFANGRDTLEELRRACQQDAAPLLLSAEEQLEIAARHQIEGADDGRNYVATI